MIDGGFRSTRDWLIFPLTPERPEAVLGKWAGYHKPRAARVQFTFNAAKSRSYRQSGLLTTIFLADLDLLRTGTLSLVTARQVLLTCSTRPVR